MGEDLVNMVKVTDRNGETRYERLGDADVRGLVSTLPPAQKGYKWVIQKISDPNSRLQAIINESPNDAWGA